MTSGIGHPSFYPGLSVTTTSTSSSPAEKAGIKINDVILKINGRDIVGSETAISEFIGTIRTNANKEIILEVLRNPESRSTKEIEGLKRDGVYTATVDRIALTPVEGIICIYIYLTLLYLASRLFLPLSYLILSLNIHHCAPSIHFIVFIAVIIIIVIVNKLIFYFLII